jgi:hypothetical protein
MKLLSYSPFSVFENGGGSRIFRRLYQNNEDKVQSFFVKHFNGEPVSGNIPETYVSVFPLLKPWMKWYLRRWAMNLQTGTFKSGTIKRIRKAVSRIECDVIHVANHGPFSAALCDDIERSGKPLWVSFHDHFATTGGFVEDTGRLWKLANRRLVISEQLGNEYSRLFGKQSFEIITDGVLKDELSLPAPISRKSITVYFAGLLHFDYLPLFKVLADALTMIAKQGIDVKLVLRGTLKVDFLANRNFEVEYRPVTLNNAELKKELDEASILYLPIKFSIPEFYLYSLSTKMVGYLAAPGTILYHGPGDSAACRLLTDTDSAVSCHTLEVNDLVNAIQTIVNSKENSYSINAKQVVKERFILENIRRRFWQTSKVAIAEQAV